MSATSPHQQNDYNCLGHGGWAIVAGCLPIAATFALLALRVI